MHRIVYPDGSFRQSKVLGVARMFGYACVGTAGFLLLLSQVFHSGFANALAGFLLVGGLTSSLGAVTRRWVGEFVGLPLVVAGLMSLGVISWSAQSDFAMLLATANLLLLTGFSTLLVGRWRSVLAVYRMAMFVGRWS